MDIFFEELSELLLRTKQARHQSAGIKCPASSAGMAYADELTRIGADFGKLAVRIKQEAARIARCEAQGREAMPECQPTPENAAEALRVRQEADL